MLFGILLCISIIFDFGQALSLDAASNNVLFLIWFNFCSIRCQIIAEISYDVTNDYNQKLEIHHPILFIRLLFLVVNTALLGKFFEELSDTLGWNWKFPW